ncbi:phosphotransferase family protein [Enterovibrio coralii]|uniref:Aminoglycoside phosphotransferase domain-containing protein n=1 Tax=Enterovibrio coralii TaxID=294935 RepID=A0A135I913_9GAMM|nr:aminoglycoside phosphotransferase family protein [Enterovibrio coralii]KXF81874.1 hypothetical protein ATN88_20505 [Enterovibrio coralii]
MSLPEPIKENLKFLLVEVTALLEKLDSYLLTENKVKAQGILDRSGYAYNLRQRIQNRSMAYAADNSPSDAVRARAISDIAGYLDRLTELTRDCVLQTRRLPEQHDLPLDVYRPLLRRVIKSIPVIDKALLHNDANQALKLGRAESKLNRLYQSLLSNKTEQLKKRKNTEELITGLFIAHIFEQMGEVLLTIGESILSSQLGQTIDMQRFSVMEEAMSEYTQIQNVANLDICPVAETRSGSGISAVSLPMREKTKSRKPHLAIYKDGEQKKLREERDGVESWHRIYPGVAPQILTYKKKGDLAALLIEHLDGQTFDHIVLKGSPELRTRAIEALAKTLTAIWDETRKRESVRANFMAQTRKRLSSVYELHPQFEEGKSQVCSYAIDTLDGLMQKVEKLEDALPPTFSVFIHGDFNVDNILFNEQNSRIRFIDLHRSTYMDYVQDVSVFMVSNYRLQAMDADSRARINSQINAFYELMDAFAKKRGDKTFNVRLAIGLARSFITSTRFIFDPNIAKRLYLRAQYLLRQLSTLNADEAEQYRLNIREIFSE